MAQDAERKTLRAGTVLTMAGGPSGPGAVSMAGGPSGPGAVSIAGERIAAVGDGAGDGAPALDFGDRVILPGFVDVHAHYEVAARVGYQTVDVRAPQCSSVADVLEVLREGARDTDSGWVIGQGNLFFDQKLAERRFPTREELDSVSTDIAIAVRAGGHITMLNSKALELAGIDESYEEPKGSVTGQPIVERDPDGRVTGVVKEMDNLLPFPELDRQQLKQALREGAENLFSAHGVTTVGEISETVDGLLAMDELAGAGELPLRVAVYQWVPGTMSVDDATSRSLALSSRPDQVCLQGIKIFADGGFSAASAATKKPYVVGQPHNCGTLAVSPDYVAEVAERASAAGLQMAIHANGERAQELVCDALARVGAGNGGFPLAPRVEHAGNFLPDRALTDRWRAAGIVPVPQPVFIYTIGDFIPAYLGDHAAHGQFPLRWLIDEGWSLSGSSDVWIGSERPQTRPLFSIWCCVERRGFSGREIEPEQAITVDEALWMHTRGGARVLGVEDERGSIEAGKLADLVVLARDPRKVPPAEIPNIEVDYVFLGGRCVHRRPGAEPYKEVVA
jgi:predicted amidohydrolase YtcJ